MHTRLRIPVVLIAANLALAPALRAQITEVARTPIAETAQLTFGYRCDDRFVIRNDGTNAVNVEYGLEKGNEHIKLALGAREIVELDSRSGAAMELWMDSKLIARAIKEKRSCKDLPGNASVLVAPLEVQVSEREQRSTFGVGFSPFYDPWMYGYYGSYGAFGYRPFYRGFVGVPIIIGRVHARPRGR